MPKIPKTLTTLESQLLLNKLLNGTLPETAKNRDLRNYCMALLMLDAGLRIGEVCKLEIRDLVFNGEPVKAVTIRPEISKTKTERTVPLSSRVQEALKIAISKLNDVGLLRGHYPVFYKVIRNQARPDGEGDKIRPITIRQVQRIIGDASFAAFGRHIHPHVLRHTFGTRIARIAGTREAQILLGHKNLNSTQIYINPNGDELVNAVELASRNGSGQGVRR